MTFKPNAAVTGIGSLPFQDTATAIEFVREYSSEIPFWPQLPRRSVKENMLLQPFGVIAELLELQLDGPVVRINSADLERFCVGISKASPELYRINAPGLFSLLEVLSEPTERKPVAIKGQIVGPVTALSSFFVGVEPLFEHEAAGRRLVEFVCRQIRWQIELCKAICSQVVIFLDEPMLTVALGERACARAELFCDAIKSCLSVIKEAGGIAGVHSCADVEPDSLFKIGIDLFSFNATEEFGHLAKVLNSPGLKAFLDRGGVLALGLVPTDSTLFDLNCGTVVEDLRRMCSELKIPWRQFVEQSMVTASCGLAGLDSAAATRSFELASELSLLLRNC